MIVILDQRERDTANLRQALAVKDAMFEEKRILRRRATAPVVKRWRFPRHSKEKGAAAVWIGGVATAVTGDDPLAARDIHVICWPGVCGVNSGVGRFTHVGW